MLDNLKYDILDALLKASNEYVFYGEISEKTIRDISRIDGEIYVKILELFVKLDADIEFLHILSAYKSIPDCEFLKLLDSCISSLDIKKNPKFYIEIGNEIILVANIYNIAKYENYENGKTVYSLIINKSISSGKLPPYSNTKIDYNSYDHREADFLTIKSKLEQFSNVKFL